MALQSFILDAFSGLVLDLERPFGIGHWTKITLRRHATEIGRVKKRNRRITRIWIRDNNVLVVPNSMISTAVLTNYSVLSRPSRLEVPVALEFTVPVERARQFLAQGAEAALAEDGILDEPPPKVVVQRIEPNGVRYKVQIHHDIKVISIDDATTCVAASLLAHIHADCLQIALPREEQIAIGSPTPQPSRGGASTTRWRWALAVDDPPTPLSTLGCFSSET